MILPTILVMVLPPPIKVRVLARMVALIQLEIQAQAVSSVNRDRADGEDVSDIVIFFVLPFDQTNEICFVFFFSLRPVLPFTMRTGGKKVSVITFTEQC